MFHRHFNKNLHHDNIHHQTGRINITSTHRDRSCEHCYPPDLIITEKFNTFWTWYSTEYPAKSYTRYTQQYLEELSYSEGDDIWLVIIDLVFSVRYYFTPNTEFRILQQNIWNVFCATNEFQLDPYLITYEESEPNQDSFDDLSEGSDLFGLTPSDSDEDIPNYLGLDQLLNQNQNQAPGMAANQQDIQQLRAAIAALTAALPGHGQALANNTAAVVGQPRREGRIADIPSFHGGNQDPVAWLEEFTRACDANGMTNARKLQVVPAYLKGPASTWWSTNQALPLNNANRIVAWVGNANNTDFTTNFPAEFRSQTLVEIWTTELDTRRQQPGEAVDVYAASLRDLYKRVETPAFQYPEAIKARKFVNGLLPDLYVSVKPFNDQGWDAAVNRAKQYELTFGDQKAAAAYTSRFASVGVAAQSDTLQKAILELTQQLQQLNSRGNNRRNNFRNNNYNNNNSNNNNNVGRQDQNTQRPRIVCYSCGQPGHVIRNCPNRDENPSTSNQPLGNQSNTNNKEKNTETVVTQLQQLLTQLVSAENNGNQSLN